MAEHHDENHELESLTDEPIESDRPPTRGLTLMMAVLFITVTISAIALWQLFMFYTQAVHAEQSQSADPRLANARYQAEADLEARAGLGGCPEADRVLRYDLDPRGQLQFDAQGLPKFLRDDSGKPARACADDRRAESCSAQSKLLRVTPRYQTLQVCVADRSACDNEATAAQHALIPRFKLKGNLPVVLQSCEAATMADAGEVCVRKQLGPCRGPSAVNVVEAKGAVDVCSTETPLDQCATANVIQINTVDAQGQPIINAVGTPIAEKGADGSPRQVCVREITANAPCAADKIVKRTVPDYQAYATCERSYDDYANYRVSIDRVRDQMSAEWAAQRSSLLRPTPDPDPRPITTKLVSP